MTVSVSSAVFLCKYDFTALAVCLELLLCWKIISDCWRVNLASRWSCQILSQVLAGLPLVSQRRNWETSHQILKVFLTFQSFFCHGSQLIEIFKSLYNSLNTTSWVSILFADFPLRMALLMQNYDFMSVKFSDLWHFQWNDVNESWS